MTLKNEAAARIAVHSGNTRMLADYPFYAAIACSLKLRPTEDIPTMATDMVHLFFNPDFTTSLTKPQVVGGLAHETMHVYLKHPIRAESLVDCMDKHYSDHVEEHLCYWPLAQIAMDMSINPRLKRAGFELIEGAVFPEKEFWDCSFEEHFKRLKKQCKGKPPQVIQCGSCSGVKPYRGKDGGKPTPAEIAKAESDVNRLIFTAADLARAAGRLPADIEREIYSLLAPRIVWHEILRRFMHSFSKNDYRMTPPNRRFVSQGLYLPSLRSEAVGDVLLILDGSGSTYQVFPQFIGEFASILLDVKPRRLHVMVWDTRCTWLEQFDNFGCESEQDVAAMQSKMGAGGGSQFADCFDYFEREVGVRPEVAIVLTDMEIGFPEDPGYPVMWISTTDIIGPFGETVQMEGVD